MKTLGCHGSPFTGLQWSQLLQAAAGKREGGWSTFTVLAKGGLLFFENNFSFYCLSLDWSSFDLNLNSFKCLCGNDQSVCGHWEITSCEKAYNCYFKKCCVFVYDESETTYSYWVIVHTQLQHYVVFGCRHSLLFTTNGGQSQRRLSVIASYMSSGQGHTQLIKCLRHRDFRSLLKVLAAVYWHVTDSTAAQVNQIQSVSQAGRQAEPASSTDRRCDTHPSHRDTHPVTERDGRMCPARFTAQVSRVLLLKSLSWAFSVDEPWPGLLERSRELKVTVINHFMVLPWEIEHKYRRN